MERKREAGQESSVDGSDWEDFGLAEEDNPGKNNPGNPGLGKKAAKAAWGVAKTLVTGGGYAMASGVARLVAGRRRRMLKSGDVIEGKSRRVN